MSIKRDEYVKAPLSTYEYTAEEVKELDRCAKDFWHFIKYVKIVHPDRGRIAFDPYPFQVEVLKVMLSTRFSILCLARQCGKCLCSNTMITLRNKKTGQIEEIAIGDLFDKFAA
jgi:hypothetical protein